MSYSIRHCDAIAHIPESTWATCFAQGGPALQYPFLKALEDSGSVGGDSGWQPKHLLIYHNEVICAILPGYVKHHSYGEYVFDHAWANAYAQHGLNYYPKWINAIPFTPVTGQRIGFVSGSEVSVIYQYLNTALPQWLEEQGYHSGHILFANDAERQQFQAQTSFAHRWSLQFEWRNQQYLDFDHYLSFMVARRRKTIKKERQKIAQQGLVIEQFYGDSLTPEIMAVFYECYQATYLKRSGHKGYLSQAFFTQILRDFQDSLMVVMAFHEARPVASALFLYDKCDLYGRYWGALEEFDGLHFECCYYRGIEFAIANDIQRFNPGTQGEHKILRGFAPVFCHSFHYLQHPDFATAVEDFVRREATGIHAYKLQCDELLPFKQE